MTPGKAKPSVSCQRYGVAPSFFQDVKQLAVECFHSLGVFRCVNQIDRFIGVPSKVVELIGVPEAVVADVFELITDPGACIVGVCG